MSVVDGQAVSAAVTNAAYMSRNSDTDTTGIVSLNNGLPASGPAIANLQQAVNALGGAIANTNSDDQTVSNIININVAVQAYNQFFRLDYTGGGAMSNTPLGTDPTNFIDKMRVYLIGTSDINFVTVNNANVQYGCILNGNITLNEYTILTLIYDATSERFIEVSRND